MAGQGRGDLDQTFEDARGPNSRSFTIERQENLIAGINKYRNHGFTVTTTLELIKKDGEFNQMFVDCPPSLMETWFNALVVDNRVHPLVSNNTVVQSLGIGHGGDRELALGNLLVQFLELASPVIGSNLNRQN